MSARADSRHGLTAGVSPDDLPNRTQNYGVTRGILGNTPVITVTSDNVSSIKIAESDSVSCGESELAAPSSTRIPSPASTLPVLDVERFIEETARMRRAS